MADLSEIALESKPVSTDGHFIWKINIEPTIVDAVRNKSYIDSPPFETSISGHCLWARLHPRSQNNPRYTSLHIHLNAPYGGPFRGSVKFLLVDQSKEPPWEHPTSTCQGTLTDVGFIEHACILQAESRHVRNGSIWIIIKVHQTAEEKFMNYEPNMRDAFTCLEQAL